MQLEEELKILKEFHKDSWGQYGSELCAGDMIAQEEKLEEKIKNLKNEMES
jgi:hypothetical protein